MIVYPVRPTHRIQALPDIGPIAPGATSVSKSFKFTQKMRIVWVSALATGVAQGEGLNSLAMSMKSSREGESFFIDGTGEAFLPFSHLVGQDGSRVWAIDPAKDLRALVDSTFEWSVIVRNLHNGNTFTPSIALGLLCGWGDCLATASCPR